MNSSNQMFPSFTQFFIVTLKALQALFFSGLLVVVPLGITILILVGLFNFFDGWFRTLKRIWLHDSPEWIVRYLSEGTKESIDYFVQGLPPFGIGFVLTLVLILLIGFMTRVYLGQKLVRFFEWAFNQIPGVSIIYGGLKQVVEQLIGRGNKLFDRVVLIEYPRKGIYSLAFVTGHAAYFEPILNQKLYYLFVATSPNPTSGIFIMVPEDDMIVLSLPVDEAMKMVISSGMVSPSVSDQFIKHKNENKMKD